MWEVDSFSLSLSDLDSLFITSVFSSTAMYLGNTDRRSCSCCRGNRQGLQYVLRKMAMGFETWYSGPLSFCLTEVTICLQWLQKKETAIKSPLKRCPVYLVDRISSICLLAVNSVHSGLPILWLLGFRQVND